MLDRLIDRYSRERTFQSCSVRAIPRNLGIHLLPAPTREKNKVGVVIRLELRAQARFLACLKKIAHSARGQRPEREVNELDPTRVMASQKRVSDVLEKVLPLRIRFLLANVGQVFVNCWRNCQSTSKSPKIKLVKY